MNVRCGTLTVGVGEPPIAHAAGRKAAGVTRDIILRGVAHSLDAQGGRPYDREMCRRRRG
eukprot:821163-Rhodomonas_salina.2